MSSINTRMINIIWGPRKYKTMLVALTLVTTYKAYSSET